jgi:hypothetical protein
MLPLVKRVAFGVRERLPAHVEVDELAANGVLGLIDAVAKYDPAKRVNFLTYARYRVRGQFWTVFAPPILPLATYEAKVNEFNAFIANCRPQREGLSEMKMSPTHLK